MALIGKKISINTQIITLYVGMFFVVAVSYFVVSRNYDKISLQKNKINEIETIKFELYELNFKIASNEISKLQMIASINNINIHFNKLINKNSVIYSTTLSDSTKTENLLVHLSDNEKRFYDAFKNWRYFAYLLDESHIQYQPNRPINEQLSKENPILLQNLTILRQAISETLADIRKSYLIDYDTIKYKHSAYFFLISVIDLIYIIYMFFYTKRIILTPIKTLIGKKEKIRFTEKKLPPIKANTYEFNLIDGFINSLHKENRDATNYIKNIANKKSSKDYEIFSFYKNSELFRSINKMQKDLDTLAVQEKERQWSIEGQSLLSDILNKFHNDFERLSKEIIRNLVSYTDALQGALFIVQAGRDGDEYLELVSSYAFDRFNNIRKRIEKGEGTLGQVWIENKGLYLENIPEDHVQIKSFTGNARPKSILIETLVDNNEFYGVIEIASLKTFNAHEQEFVRKVAQSIAATLASVENNNRTKTLLKESQEIATALRKEEQTVLLNLEKLSETQEEIKRREIQKENELKAFTEQYNEEINKQTKILEAKESEIDDLKAKLEHAVMDNETIRALNLELKNVKFEFNKQLNDLEETVKIKEMRVQKYKKKIDGLVG